MSVWLDGGSHAAGCKVGEDGAPMWRFHGVEMRARDGSRRGVTTPHLLFTCGVFGSRNGCDVWRLVPISAVMDLLSGVDVAQDGSLEVLR